MPACGRMVRASSPGLARGGVIRARDSCAPAAGRVERGVPAHTLPPRRSPPPWTWRRSSVGVPRPVPDRRAAPQAAEPAPDRGGLRPGPAGPHALPHRPGGSALPHRRDHGRASSPRRRASGRRGWPTAWTGTTTCSCMRSPPRSVSRRRWPSPRSFAVALKAEEVLGRGRARMGSEDRGGRSASRWGVALGCFRIVTGTPLPWYIVAAYVVVIVQTFRSSRAIVPLAYDSGGVTTSTVTVPGGRCAGAGPPPPPCPGAAR